MQTSCIQRRLEDLALLNYCLADLLPSSLDMIINVLPDSMLRFSCRLAKVVLGNSSAD